MYDNMVNNNVKNNVQERRLRAGIRQSDLAQAVGVTRQTIIALEKGNYTPSVQLALRVAGYFKINVEDIFKLI